MPPFYKRHNGKEPPRVKSVLTPPRAPLQKTPTGSTDPALSINTLTHALQATCAPVAQEEEDPKRSDKPNSVGRAACLLNDEPVRIYVPLLMRPWIMQACHWTASCHLGTTHTLRMLERLY